ncbi:putative Kunitz family trypsin and protease inhibitor protein [Hibiscus syriacus]|uniref:Kunitz family trypsin and protease inhibitor protein n=1 Tax=Hibiscus syriacus TaxID=106335 RepID=A0A6A2ZBC0_HIBSY|nr:putative Kunitz family trypsin and protease inhibitor protein [Hibiscus syriacus]
MRRRAQWVLAFDESLLKFVVATSGRETLNNRFKIERFEDDYKLAFCPGVCDTCRPVCGDLGVFIDDDGIRRLVLADEPLKQNVQRGDLKPENLDLRVAIYYGIPSTSSVLAFDPIRRLLAIGTLTAVGNCRIMLWLRIQQGCSPYVESGLLQPLILDQYDTNEAEAGSREQNVIATISSHYDKKQQLKKPCNVNTGD